MEIALIIIAGILLCLNLVQFIILIKRNNQKNNVTKLTDQDIKLVKDSVVESINILNTSVSALVASDNKKIIEEFVKKNEEVDKSIKDLLGSQSKFVEEVKLILNKYEKTQNEFNEKENRLINDFKVESLNKQNEQKDQIMKKLSDEIRDFKEELNKHLKESDKSIKEKLEDFQKTTKESITSLNETVNKNLSEIREDNNKKLDKINESVNDKLQKTLEEKLKDSFKTVIEGIGSVNQAVGEIKGLATDVGSLKNVLTNVKTKGIMGEVILGNIIRDFLTAGQYEENIATKKGSTERVEYAIKLPGTKDEVIYLPVDSKFPYEPYSIISQSSDVNEINEARKKLRLNLLSYAKDVSEKYIDVPNTTDFAVIFLPLEGLYLEALNMGLFEEIQSKYKVNLTGPTTFTAFINSLNMGFKSLMIQKKSADVFKLLGAVKTEFEKFATALDKTQKKFNDAADELDKLVGTRTRMLNSKLKTIDSLGEEETKLLLGDSSKE